MTDAAEIDPNEPIIERGRANTWRALHPGTREPLTGWLGGTPGIAARAGEAALRKLRVKVRPCIVSGCQNMVRSEGAHHRMCNRCRSGDTERLWNRWGEP